MDGWMDGWIDRQTHTTFCADIVRCHILEKTASSLIAVNVITHYFGKLPVVAAVQQL